MVGYEAVMWGLDGAYIAARRRDLAGAARAARDTRDAIAWRAPEVRRQMLREMVIMARCVTPTLRQFYRFLAACMLVSLREGGAW